MKFFDPYFYVKLFFSLVRACDFSLFARTVLIVSPLVTGFTIALKLFSGKRVRVGAGFPILYVLISLSFFGFAYADAAYIGKTFSSVTAAVIAAAALLIAQFVLYLCFVFAARVKALPEKKRRYAAKVSETPIAHVDDPPKKAYPLKSNVSSEKGERAYGFDTAELMKFLEKIGDKGLSFSDEEEYNRLINKTKFLSGVEITKETAPDFCELFMRSVKLAARYET